jgi:AraC-like DNA-binding protein
MKILPFKIAKPVNESVWIQNDDQPHLYDILHQHDEFQITLIQESTGNLIAGSRICEFEPGDIFVFGTRLPHAFRNDAVYYQQGQNLKARALSVYFEWDVFGNAFWNLPENKMLVDFGHKAERGIHFKAGLNGALVAAIEQLAMASEAERLIGLFSVLLQLAKCNDSEILSTEGTYNKLNETEEKRLDAIYRFTLKEYSRAISLDEIAGVANMTINSFCRYFKARTRKSYLDFLTEFRIGQACRLLQQGEVSIADVGYRVGFGNLSNFNRKFKEINGCTPKEYRNKQKLT